LAAPSTPLCLTLINDLSRLTRKIYLRLPRYESGREFVELMSRPTNQSIGFFSWKPTRKDGCRSRQVGCQMANEGAVRGLAQSPKTIRSCPHELPTIQTLGHLAVVRTLRLAPQRHRLSQMCPTRNALVSSGGCNTPRSRKQITSKTA
jgi:hypothetical protein